MLLCLTRPLVLKCAVKSFGGHECYVVVIKYVNAMLPSHTKAPTWLQTPIDESNLVPGAQLCLTQ